MKKQGRFRSIQRQMAPLLLGGMLGVGIVPALQAQDTTKAARFYEDALVRYEKKDIAGTIIQLKNALQIDPNMLPVQMLLGRALMQNGEVAAAEVAFGEALRLGVNRAEVVLPLGRAYVAQGKHKLLLEQKTFDPTGLPPATQLQLHLLRASAHADLGESRNAMRAIEEARAIDNRQADVWLAEVPIRIRARQLKEALAAVDKAATLSASTAELWFQKGSIQHVQGDLKGALAAYDRVLLADTTAIEARVARIGIYLDLSKFADAARDVTELRKAAPADPRGAYLNALLLVRDGNAAGAATALKEVTDLLDPVPMEFVRFRSQLLMLNGLAHFGLNQREKAKQYLEAFQRNQNYSPTSKLLARIYLGENNAAQASSVLETYLKAQPGDGQAMTLLATAYMSLGRHAKATALMQEALKAQDNPAYRAALGMSLIGGGQAANGVSELEAAFNKDPGQLQAATTLIQLYLQNNQAGKAVPVAESLVKQNPANASFQNLLGMAQGQSGNITGARASFEKAIQLSGQLSSAKINLARLEVATKSLDAANARLIELLKTDEKNSEAMSELALIADRKGQQADAQRWLEKARDAAGPKDLRWGLILVDFHLRYGRPGPALEAAKVASSKAPEDLTTLLAYSKAQIAIGDTIGAKNTLTGATRFAEYKPGRQVEVAMLQMQANNPAGAAYSLEKALSSSPDYLPAQILMAEVDLRLKDYPKAEKRARDIVLQNPRLAIGHSLVGDVALAKGQSGVAVDAYRKAHQIQPSSDTVMRLFTALSGQDSGKASVALAEQWLKATPRDVRVRKALGNAYVRAGNFAAAKANYEAVIKIDPGNPEVLNNLANVQLRLNDPAAVKTAELALSKAPGNAIMTDTLGWALFQNGQTDRALQMLRDARLRLPGNAEIHYHLGAVLAQTGRKVEAKEELEAALKTGNQFEGAADAAKLLARLK